MLFSKCPPSTTDHTHPAGTMRQACCSLIRVVCAMLVLPYANSSQSWMDSWHYSCEKRANGAWSIFQNKIGETGYGLREEKGLSSLADDIRTDALRLADSPHVYALMGGGEWGPRAVAKAVLESVYVNPWNRVVIVDMAEAVSVHRTRGLDEAQLWLKERVAPAIKTCPGQAAFVFDNVHVLNGEDVLLLDPFLLLFEDGRSNMAYGDGKVSGDGSVFLLLFNEDYSGHDTGLDGKARLHLAWEFKDERFTTTAFVGRVDAAALLPTVPFLSNSDQSALEDVWRDASKKRKTLTSRVNEIGDTISTAISDAATPAVLGATVAAALITGTAVCWAMGKFGGPEEPAKTEEGSRVASDYVGGDNGSAGGPGAKGKKKAGTGRKQKAFGARGGGGAGALPDGKEGSVFRGGLDSNGCSEAMDRPPARENGDFNYRDCVGDDVDPATARTPRSAREAPPPSPLSARTRNGKEKGKKAGDVDARMAAVSGTRDRRGRRRADSAQVS